MSHIFISDSTGIVIDIKRNNNHFFIPNRVKCKKCEKYIYQIMSFSLKITSGITKENINLMNKLVPCLTDQEYQVKNILE